MGGFKNKQLNNFMKQSIFDDMINFIFVSLEKMRNVHILENKKILNDEEKIRTHLIQNYLNNDEFKNNIGYNTLELRFEPEIPENYNEKQEEYIGRVDIKVISQDYLKNSQNYYIIECKRIDGTKKLNKLFVKEGICRFVLENPKYSSFNDKNIMLAFIISNINIEQNVTSIDLIQLEDSNINVIEKMYKCYMDNKDYYLYRNKYQCGSKKIELSHMFYDLSQIIL